MTNEIIHRQLNPLLKKYDLGYEQFLNNCVGIPISKIPKPVRKVLIELVNTSILTSPEAVSRCIGISISSLKNIQYNK